jgi:hypothetical protein
MEKLVKNYNEFINESNVDNQMLRIKMKNIPRYVADVLTKSGCDATDPDRETAYWVKYVNEISTKRLYNFIRDDQNFRLIDAHNIVFYEYENSDKDYWSISLYKKDMSNGFIIRNSVYPLTPDDAWDLL